MLEHDKHYKESLQAMYNLLVPGGFLLLTAAGFNRAEHGTTRTTPEASPFTTDYYENITYQMLFSFIKTLPPVNEYKITEFNEGKDIALVLIK